MITGGAGFIGSHVVRLFVTKYPDYQILNLDALTYAGNLENLVDIADAPNYSIVKGDITNEQFIAEFFKTQQFTSAAAHRREALQRQAQPAQQRQETANVGSLRPL